MRTKVSQLLVLLFVLLSTTGWWWTNKIDKKLGEFEKRLQTVTSIEDGKVLLDEINNHIRWHADPKHEKMSPEQLARAEGLRDQLKARGVKIIKEEAGAAIQKGVEWLKSIEFKQKIEWFLGKDDPRRKDFACTTLRAPTDPLYGEGCP